MSATDSRFNLLLWLVPAALLGVIGYVLFQTLGADTRPVPAPAPPVAQPQPQPLGFPRTLADDSGRKLVLPAKPVRIVPGDTGMADILSALVESQRIAALPVWVDTYGGAREFFETNTNISRFQKYQAEPLLALKPDLVLTDSYQDAATTSILRQQGIPVLQFAKLRTFDGIKGAILIAGSATGEEQKAADLATEFDNRLQALAADFNGMKRPRALCYSNYGQGYAVGTGESQDEILRRAGAENAAAEMNLAGHVTFSFEQLLKLNPDWLIVGGDNGMQSPQAQLLLNETVLSNLQAIKERHIAVVPERYFSSISQYVVNAVEILARQLHPEAFPRRTDY